MRILLVNKHLYPSGGAESVFFHQWRLLEADGHAVIPFAMAHPRNTLTAFDEYLVPYVNYQRDRSLLSAVSAAHSIYSSSEAKCRIRRLIAETQPDIAHLHNIYHQLSPSILEALAEAGVPALMTLHDYKLACPNYRLYTEGAPCTRCVGSHFHHAVVHRCVKGSRAKSLVCAVENSLHRWRGAYAGIATFITPSRFLRDVMIEAGLPETKLLFWPHPVDLPPVPRSHDAGYVLYSGRLVAEKGVRTLIGAAARLPHVEFRLAGDGPLRAEIESWCLERSLYNVRFLGFVQPDELPALIRHARCLAVPSEWYENCSMALLEALSHGVPVVASRIGGLPEFVEHGEEGLLVAPGDEAELADALGQLASDPALAGKMGWAARKRAERDHAPRPYLERLLRLYAGCLEGRAPAMAADGIPEPALAGAQQAGEAA